MKWKLVKREVREKFGDAIADEFDEELGVAWGAKSGGRSYVASYMADIGGTATVANARGNDVLGSAARMVVIGRVGEYKSIDEAKQACVDHRNELRRLYAV